MLSYVLGQRGDSDHENDDGGTTEDWKDSLEVSASVRQSESAKNGGDEENEIVISLRKRVQRITVRPTTHILPCFISIITVANISYPLKNSSATSRDDYPSSDRRRYLAVRLGRARSAAHPEA